MSGYKLIYFNLTGRGEPIRFLLSYAGVAFEDNRITPDAWPQLKSKTPLGQLPILEVDGKTLYQTRAIIRYLANKYNLFGSNEFEAFEVDVAIETIDDLREVLGTWYFTADAAQKTKAKAATFDKAAFLLTKLDATVEKNGGFFVSGKLTAADIVFAGFSYIFSHIVGKDIIADYPNLMSVVDKVVAQPGIKSYLAKRPKTDF